MRLDLMNSVLECLLFSTRNELESIDYASLFNCENYSSHFLSLLRLLARLSRPEQSSCRAEWIFVVKCKNKHYKSFANAHMEIVSRNLVHEICLHSSFCFVFTLRAQPILFLIARCNVCISHSKHKNALAIKTGKFVDCVCGDAEVDCGSALATWPVSIYSKVLQPCFANWFKVWANASSSRALSMSPQSYAPFSWTFQSCESFSS